MFILKYNTLEYFINHKTENWLLSQTWNAYSRHSSWSITFERKRWRRIRSCVKVDIFRTLCLFVSATDWVCIKKIMIKIDTFSSVVSAMILKQKKTNAYTIQPLRVGLKLTLCDLFLGVRYFSGDEYGNSSVVLGRVSLERQQQPKKMLGPVLRNQISLRF